MHFASGDPAPYAGTGATIADIIDYSFNAQGLFGANVTISVPGGSLPREGLIVATRADGSFRVVARESVPLPNAPATTWRLSSGRPYVNGNGQVAFEGYVYPNDYPPPASITSYDTIWSEAGGLHAVSTRLSEPNYTRFALLRGFSDNGGVLYERGGYQPNGSAILGDDPELVLEEDGRRYELWQRGWPAPIGGCTPGHLCGGQHDFLFGSALASDGTAIFGSQLKGSGINTLNNDVIFRRTSAGTEVLVRDGDSAWGMPDGYRFSHVIAPNVLFNDEVVFSSYLDTPSGVELQYSIFANTGGVERLVARYGAPAPGFGGAKHFGDFTRFYPTETGRPVVVANLQGPTYLAAVFREEAAGLSLVFDSNQPAVGIPDAKVSIYDSSLHESPVTGTTVLNAYWYSPDPLLSGHGLWRIDDGQWQLLLSTDQSIEVSPGDERTIQQLDARSFTADGVLPIGIYFTDGSRAVMSWTDAPQRLAGDANDNGALDAADYVLWRKNFGQPVLGGYSADANGDRLISQEDYASWRGNFGRGPQGHLSAAVPEPTTFMLLGLSLIGSVRRRRKHPEHHGLDLSEAR